jgi:hypothetical protein
MCPGSPSSSIGTPQLQWLCICNKSVEAEETVRTVCALPCLTTPTCVQRSKRAGSHGHVEYQIEEMCTALTFVRCATASVHSALISSQQFCLYQPYYLQVWQWFKTATTCRHAYLTSKFDGGVDASTTCDTRCDCCLKQKYMLPQALAFESDFECAQHVAS